MPNISVMRVFMVRSGFGMAWCCFNGTGHALVRQRFAVRVRCLGVRVKPGHDD
jgi:hypothetical protein